MNPFQHMLYTVITETFSQECDNLEGAAQAAGEQSGTSELVFKVRFDLPIPEGFDGYRQLTMVLYCPTGSTYTQVWIRESSTLAPFGQLNGEKTLGRYREEWSAWTKIADHSSCWREGVEKVLNTPGIRSLITGGKGDKGWYNLVEVPNFNTPAGES